MKLFNRLHELSNAIYCATQAPLLHYSGMAVFFAEIVLFYTLVNFQNFMKLNTLITVFILTAITANGQSQEVSMDELKKYIHTMDSIETLKNNLTVKMNKLSKGNKDVSTSRYHEIFPIINNQAKLTEVKATPAEITYVKKAVAIRDEETKKFQLSYQSLINDYLGQKTFSKVRNSLKADPNVKKAYDSLTAKPIRP